MKDETSRNLKPKEWIIIIITYKIVAAAVVVKYDFELF